MASPERRARPATEYLAGAGRKIPKELFEACFQEEE